MLRACRVRASLGMSSRISVREQAKQVAVARAKHARDAKGTVRAGTSMLRDPLPCELGAVLGDEMSEDEGHWFIDELVWGPYPWMHWARKFFWQECQEWTISGNKSTGLCGSSSGWTFHPS